MTVLLLFAFLSGLVTIFAPCIWPILPIVLSSSTTGGKKKALGITIGVMVSFAFFTLSLSYIVKIIPFDPNILRLVAVIIIGFLGLTLLIPSLNGLLEGWVSRLSGMFGNKTKREGNDFGTGLLTGAALGVVWTPCAGPILATIATLAATQRINAAIVWVTIVYVIGIGIPLFIFSLAGGRLFSKSRILSQYTGIVQKIFGIVMILTALAILINADKTIQARLLDYFPSYSSILNKLENNEAVTKELDKLRGAPKNEKVNMPFPQSDRLPNLGVAPEFAGISKWLNSSPLTMAELKGKVVLVDFWTYTCINCIRTLPYVTSWYEKYKDQGFIVIGVHTPEFEFEKKTQNVANAITQYKIHYPVAQDNDYKTWQAYNNHYWPAKYLVDANGNLRYTHFGEGEYEETEMHIKALLEEAGKKTDDSVLNLEDETPHSAQTPETYLGAARMERFASNEQITHGKSTYTLSTGFPRHYVGYSGTWEVEDEYSKSILNAKLEIKFISNKVFLVITPKTNKDGIKVFLDGKVVSQSEAGKDVKNGYAVLDEPRLYELINMKEKGEHVLRLEFETEGTEVFAFTFG
jgi:cytochrome c biogenesis protein CcdA/thiol-disulfide isomerase/thioredoxin